MLYKIGDFAKLLNTSIRTLRYYDEINILKPVEIDIYTNYRYYSINQIEEYNIIKLLKEVGFSLEEIKLNKNNYNNEIMLERKIKLSLEIDKIKSKIKQVDYLRSNVVNGKIMFNYETKQNNMKKSIF